MHTKWLMDHADIPIRYILTREEKLVELFLQNYESVYWLSKLKERAETKNMADVHGSHDYRLENILGKCSILGFSKDIPVFAQYLQFIIDFLNEHIHKPVQDILDFAKIYAYRDYETVLSCFLPMLGYADEKSVQYITQKRIDLLYSFTKQKRYDIYVDGSKFKGVKKEWQPFLLNLDLYADGNIALPTTHDYILFAGMYKTVDRENQQKIETIVQWLFDERYTSISRRYGYFYVPKGAYPVKAVIFKMHLENISTAEAVLDKGALDEIIFMCYILSHFESGRKSEWFQSAMSYLSLYKTEDGRYRFPKNMLTEKTDGYVIFGKHMNIGENKKSKQYSEILSTYWMDQIITQKG